MINTVPLISFKHAGQLAATHKTEKLICAVDTCLIVISFIVPLELECCFFCTDRPAESIQSARRKLKGQELITEKAAVRDFGKSFFKSGRLLLVHRLLQMGSFVLMVVGQFESSFSGGLFCVTHVCCCIFRI